MIKPKVSGYYSATLKSMLFHYRNVFLDSKQGLKDNGPDKFSAIHDSLQIKEYLLWGEIQGRK